MAHFARIDNDNKVVEVLVVANSLEHRGQEFLNDELGLTGNWIQTSYNGTIRKNFAGIGYTYDADRDAFIPPKPTEGNYVLNDETCRWEELINDV